MERKFKHYVITLFNLNLHWEGKDTKVDEEYLKYRFKLFEDNTLKSFENQTNKNFTWILLFSTNTPEKYKEVIENLQKKYGYIEPVFIEDKDAKDFRDIVINYIKENNTDNSVIVSTRCDNDDIINKDFIKDIQENIIFENCFLTFPLGYQFDFNKRVISKYHFPNNHFTTYISLDGEKTIHSFLHMQIYSEAKVIEINNNKPLWIELIHNNNIYNCMGTLKFSNYFVNEDIKDNYGGDLKYQRNIFYIIICYFYFIIHKLFVKRKKIFKRIKDKLALLKHRNSK